MHGRLRPKYGRYLSWFQFLRTSFRTKFAHWLSIMIIHSFKAWFTRVKQAQEQAQTQRQAVWTGAKQTQEQEKGNVSFFLFLRLCLLHDFTRVNRGRSKRKRVGKKQNGGTKRKYRREAGRGCSCLHLLYDKFCPDYKSMDKKNLAWQDIAETVGLPNGNF